MPVSSFINKNNSSSNKAGKMSVNEQANTSSGRRFSFKNLFPDLRTETMIQNEKERVAAALAKGKQEKALHEAYAASHRGPSTESSRS